MGAFGGVTLGVLKVKVLDQSVNSPATVARTRTAPAAGVAADRLRFAFASAGDICELILRGLANQHIRQLIRLIEG